MTQGEQAYQVVICGAGPVGMACAAHLVKRGMAPDALCLIDAKPLAQAQEDPRSIALSHGSTELLAQIGAWPFGATAIHQIHVSRRGRFGRSMMDRAEHGVDALGHVTRYGDMLNALAGVCTQLGVHVLRPARVTGKVEQAGDVLLQLEQDGVGQRTLCASIVVQAEGGVFGAQVERTQQRDYGQSAVIARVASSAPIAHRAFERFTDEGPLALLPQDGADGHHYALVWCVQPERAQALLVLDDAAFLSQLGQAFGGRLGHFTRCGARAAYPLGLNAQTVDSERTVAIGNAAQTLHPVAGQGLNLGLRDAAVLARLLARAATPAMLAEFASARKADRGVTVGLTDAMARVFADSGPAQTLLGLSLGVLDAVNPARFLLAELMMYGRRQ